MQQVKFRLDEAEKQGLAERTARAGKSLQDYLAGLVTADELVQESAEQVRVRETIRKGVVEHAMDDRAPPFRPQRAGSSGPGCPRYFSRRPVPVNQRRLLRDYERVWTSVGQLSEWF